MNFFKRIFESSEERWFRQSKKQILLLQKKNMKLQNAINLIYDSYIKSILNGFDIRNDRLKTIEDIIAEKLILITKLNKNYIELQKAFELLSHYDYENIKSISLEQIRKEVDRKIEMIKNHYDGK